MFGLAALCVESIRNCGSFRWILIIFRATHRLFAGFQCAAWWYAWCMHAGRSIRVIIVIRITLFAWQRMFWMRCSLLTLIVILWANGNYVNFKELTFQMYKMTAMDLLDFYFLRYDSMEHTNELVWTSVHQVKPPNIPNNQRRKSDHTIYSV